MFVNKVIIGGEVFKRPQIRETKNGGEFATFNIRQTNSYKTRRGERKEFSQSHSVTVFNDDALELCKRLEEGDPVIAIGELKNNKSGDKWYTGVEIGFTGEIVAPSLGVITSEEEREPAARKKEPVKERNADTVEDELDDDIPF